MPVIPVVSALVRRWGARAVGLVVTAIGLYVVFPGLLTLFGGDEHWSGRVAYAAVLEARGRLALAVGKGDEALAAFLECGRRQTAARMHFVGSWNGA